MERRAVRRPRPTPISEATMSDASSRTCIFHFVVVVVVVVVFDDEVDVGFVFV